MSHKIPWKNFSFFSTDASPIELPTDLDTITCCCLSSGFVFVGSADGSISVLNRGDALSLVTRFQAYSAQVTHIKYTAAQNALVTLGDDDFFTQCVMRVWTLPAAGDMATLTESLPHTEGVGTVAPPPPCQEHTIFSARFPPPAARVALGLCYNDDMRSHLLERVASSGEPLPSGGEGVPRAAEAPTSSSTAAAAAEAATGALSTVVVSFDVAADVSCAAVGLTSGECVLLMGDLLNPRAVKLRRLHTEIAKGRLSFVGLPAASTVQIADRFTGGRGAVGSSSNTVDVLDRETKTRGSSPQAVGGKASAAPKQPSSLLPHQVMYVVYEDCVTAWRIEASGCREVPVPMPFGASAPTSCALSSDGSLIVGSSTTSQVAQISVASPDAADGGDDVAYTDPTEANSVSVVELDANAPKRILCSYRNYKLVLIQRDANPSNFLLQAYDTAYGIRGLASTQERHTNCAFLVADRAGALLLSIRGASVQGGTAAGGYAAAQKGDAAARPQYVALRLEEISVERKLDLLISRECYVEAKQIASAQKNIDPALLVNIQRRHGDSLYAREKYAEAMEQYLDTIGVLEPSYVIRRYIQSAHLPLLTRFLEELHSRARGSIANATHTTILLNCYIKLKEERKLREFVCREDVSFDPHNAIDICRRSGQSETALLLADKYALALESVRIHLYDLRQPHRALAVLFAHGVDTVEDICRTMGRDLMAQAPAQTTSLLSSLCVQWPGPARRRALDNNGTPAKTPPPPPRRCHARDFIPAFLEHPAQLLSFLQTVVDSDVLDEEPPESNVVVYDTLFELYVTPELQNAKVDGDAAAAAASSSAAPPVESYSRRAEKALLLLERYHGRYSDYTALCLSLQHDFEEGVVFLLGRLGLTTDTFHYYLHKAQAHKQTAPEEYALAMKHLLDLCVTGSTASETAAHSEDSARRKDERTTMWRLLLTELTRGPGADAAAGVLETALEHVRTHRELGCVEVMEILCDADDSIPLEAIRGYAQESLRDLGQALERTERATAATLARVKHTQDDIDRLRCTAVVVQANTCAHCSEALDLPVVHFMCGHTFHQRCLYSATECNVCAPLHRATMDDVRAAQASSAASADSFLEQWRGADGSVSVIAAQIASGALSSFPLIPEDFSLFDMSGSAGSKATTTAAVTLDHDGASNVNMVLEDEELEVW